MAYGPFSGEIFVRDAGANLVTVISGLGVIVTFGAFGGPQGLSFGPSGELWVADSAGNAYSVYATHR